MRWWEKLRRRLKALGKGARPEERIKEIAHRKVVSLDEYRREQKKIVGRK